MFYLKSTNTEYWFDYDMNLIHYKNSILGTESWQNFYKGNMTYRKSTYRGFITSEIWYEYESNNRQIYSITRNGFERISEYDEHGNEIYYLDSADVEPRRIETTEEL